MTLATTAGPQLTAALKPQLALLVDDIRGRLEHDTEELGLWQATHRQAVEERRTAGSWTDWSEDQITQAAVGWLLTSVFVRFCEDNLLLGDTAVWIAGPDRGLRQRAEDAENDFYRRNQDFSYREWLEVSFTALRDCPATQALVDDHAALNIASPSSDAVQQLLSFWRRTGDDGDLIWSFADADVSTRFLGDLYQDLSEFAKKKYALLQTPEFVEEFILDQTLTPALKDRPLEGFKLIDPTCGSGHFLLGAFARLTERWHQEAPGLELRTRVDRALASIYGVDINPFAVAIAKFRLIVAALQACGESSLVDAPKFTLNLAAGDSLLHGPEFGGATAFDFGSTTYNKDAIASGMAYSTEDLSTLQTLLTPGQYDVVVGNPPYITVNDKALNARYREIYHYCKGKYALTAPFMERFFQLARTGNSAGWVGQITSNSFMKREFGVPLIEKFLSNLDLHLIVDSSGAYIPGHGTPTVIIVGRNQRIRRETVQAVLGIQGEPGAPTDAAQGLVWRSIVEHVDATGYTDQWISVSDLPRHGLSAHPWSLSGGGAVELLSAVELAKHTWISDAIESVGFASITGEDDAFVLGTHTPNRVSASGVEIRNFVSGTQVRDFSILNPDWAIYPYGPSADYIVPPISRLLWPLRTNLKSGLAFGQRRSDRDIPWWEYILPNKARLNANALITFAFVATHNHFVLDRGGKVFKQSAPVIKLPKDSTEDDHLRLLGTLNSSTACFWLKQNSHDKGNGGVNEGYRGEHWEVFFEFTGTTLKDFPLPATAPLARGRRIDALAQRLSAQEPGAAIVSHGAIRASIDAARTEHARVRAALVAEQEELDWEVYLNYGLIDDDLTLPVGEAPEILLGERTFEIMLARQVASGNTETTWFARHNSTPITTVPAQWPSDYRELIEKRIAAIESNPFIRLLEKPEYKRRWAGESWDSKLQSALKDWLLDRLEDHSLWFTPQGTPQPRSIGELAGHVETSTEFIDALDLWAGQKDAPVTATLIKLLADEGVPYLAAMRYKDSGLRKRAEWERVWDMQREEDAGLIAATEIPVPPKYTGADFVKQSYWPHRGKLDVPKERFISYLGAGRETDPTPLLGWAGWNHAQQGIALATIYAWRESEGVDLVKLVPVVAGMAEILPWVKQWHAGVDSNIGLDLAQYLTGQLAEKSAAVSVPVDDLNKWRPVKTTRARKATARKAVQE
ncbi:BREX-2 system adenine-specific DNA-methyltransferase PglX [Rhodococcoides yunnanense]|uniref:site-specific DNA-methyltransferase (adenine-specific) n=1 Tax=Rhodococcoides yunnanense TaxID=278209 RepID=A0ABU4BHT0_9NOCA|nr:BREX-2 system adenine-specific DNA-methyltransferase PglX [Rhodococcus yunnanensis]MDV6263766.1 BREX-2 system adenine-specific DNA-methyltransferase PglX [Rhodococcus yunnanensis]